MPDPGGSEPLFWPLRHNIHMVGTQTQMQEKNIQSYKIEISLKKEILKSDFKPDDGSAHF